MFLDKPLRLAQIQGCRGFNVLPIQALTPTNASINKNYNKWTKGFFLVRQVMEKLKFKKQEYENQKREL